MFRKGPLIYINSKVPFDESLPPLPSRRSGVPVYIYIPGLKPVKPVKTWNGLIMEG